MGDRAEGCFEFACFLTFHLVKVVVVHEIEDVLSLLADDGFDGGFFASGVLMKMAEALKGASEHSSFGAHVVTTVGDEIFEEHETLLQAADLLCALVEELNHEVFDVIPVFVVVRVSDDFLHLGI